MDCDCITLTTSLVCSSGVTADSAGACALTEVALRSFGALPVSVAFIVTSADDLDEAAVGNGGAGVDAGTDADASAVVVNVVAGEDVDGMTDDVAGTEADEVEDADAGAEIKLNGLAFLAAVVAGVRTGDEGANDVTCLGVVDTFASIVALLATTLAAI